MKTTIRLLSSARIYKKEDDSKLHPPFGDHHTCRRRGKDAAAHDDSDLVGRPLLWLTNVWNPISPAVSVSSPCRPNDNTIEQEEGDEECIVVDDEEACMVLESPSSLVLSSSDAGDTTHSTYWDVDLEQDVASKDATVKDQSAASLVNQALLSLWKKTPLPDTPIMSNAESTVSLQQQHDKDSLQDDVSEPHSLES